jgi:hypothetical protein
MESRRDNKFDAISTALASQRHLAQSAVPPPTRYGLPYYRTSHPFESFEYSTRTSAHVSPFTPVFSHLGNSSYYPIMPFRSFLISPTHSRFSSLHLMNTEIHWLQLSPLHLRFHRRDEGGAPSWANVTIDITVVVRYFPTSPCPYSIMACAYPHYRPFFTSYEAPSCHY